MKEDGIFQNIKSLTDEMDNKKSSKNEFFIPILTISISPNDEGIKRADRYLKMRENNLMFLRNFNNLYLLISIHKNASENPEQIQAWIYENEKLVCILH